MKKIIGKLVKGRGLAKEFGFPTLNLSYDGDDSGVFVVKILIDSVWRMGAAHLGARPTVADATKVCEVHVLDWDGEFANSAEDGGLGVEFEVEFLERIRGIQKFGNLEELVAQIEKDVNFVRNWYNRQEDV